ncbi:polysaccharide biosynthesis/export family protein [Paraburkholderia bryophila]|uniref:Polysaccharide export outer membrane protein n=1 Tax=Paraburkholderia bryophila TaxID=420952 RepID=A0A7Y9WTX5_9BURK|nr:polysaccharide biosynthesis/export family protein [Paraburkholderia bryophila]NYH26997.1 polysaccharide export outer membrane protein [Paraburkholderia bryophila]
MKNRSRYRLGVLTMVVTLLNSACAVAPGMRMQTSATAAVYTTDATLLAAKNSQPAASEKVDATPDTPEIAITEVDAALISQLAQRRQQQQLELSQLLSGTPREYVVGAGDVLQIVVWDHPEFAAALGSSQIQSSARPGDPLAGFIVDQNGSLTFPYAGTLQVAGLRTDEIQQRLSLALGKYFVKPQVTVRMASYRAHQVYVDGEVHSPGALSVNDVPMTFYEALSRAGGFSETADQSDLVLVRGGQSHRVNLTQLLAQGVSPSRLFLNAGDVLRVMPRDENGVYVMGEVNKPVSAVPRRTGVITLADALSQAGSVNASTADAAQMFVIRGSLTGTPEVFHLDGRSPVAMLLAKDFELQPKDVVYVDGSGLVRFNRVLTLLMPLISSGLTGGVIAK